MMPLWDGPFGWKGNIVGAGHTVFPGGGQASSNLGPGSGGGGPTPVSIAGSPSSGVVGVPYSWAPTVSGGSGTKSFSLSGSLPSGLSFSSTTGAINDPDAGSFTLTQAWWEQTTTTSYKLDAPVVRPVAENTSAIYRHDCLLLHQVNFQAPAGYNSADGYAVNKPKRLQGKNTSYISTGPGPLAHFDGSVAANNNAGVADGNADDRLQSFSFGTYGFKGTRVAFASKANGNLTQTQMEEVAINMYKLVA